MQKLTQLSDEALHNNTRALAREERKLTVEILHHLREIERRMLHAKRGNSSLVEYCVKELGYTKTAGQRRVDSMRLLKHVPEIEAKLIEGSLSITHLSDAQAFFRKEAIRESEEKKEVLDQLVGKSVMDAQRTLMSLTDRPEVHIPERVRVVSAELTEVRFVVDQQTLAQLEELKALLSHSKPGMGVKEALIKHRVKAPKDSKASTPEQKSLVPAPVPKSGRASLSRVHLPVEIRRLVYHRDGGRCTYTHSSTGRRCGSYSYLDLDHIIPVAQGGPSTPENLRVRCRTHNQLAAIRVFGGRKMAQYLPSIRLPGSEIPPRVVSTPKA